MKRVDMRKLLPRFGYEQRPGDPWVIAEAVHQRDADRCLAEPWPFAWGPPGCRALPWELRRYPDDWKAYHRSIVVMGG